MDFSINFLMTDCNRLIPPGPKKRIMKSKHGLTYNYLYMYVCEFKFGLSESLSLTTKCERIDNRNQFLFKKKKKKEIVREIIFIPHYFLEQ